MSPFGKFPRSNMENWKSSLCFITRHVHSSEAIFFRRERRRRGACILSPSYKPILCFNFLLLIPYWLVLNNQEEWDKVLFSVFNCKYIWSPVISILNSIFVFEIQTLSSPWPDIQILFTKRNIVMCILNQVLFWARRYLYLFENLRSNFWTEQKIV